MNILEYSNSKCEICSAADSVFVWGVLSRVIQIIGSICQEGTLSYGEASQFLLSPLYKWNQFGSSWIPSSLTPQYSNIGSIAHNLVFPGQIDCLYFIWSSRIKEVLPKFKETLYGWCTVLVLAHIKIRADTNPYFHFKALLTIFS